MKLRSANWSLPPELLIVKSKNQHDTYFDDMLVSSEALLWVDLSLKEDPDIHMVVSDEYGIIKEAVVRTYNQFLDVLISCDYQPAVAVLRAYKIENLI